MISVRALFAYSLRGTSAPGSGVYSAYKHVRLLATGDVSIHEMAYDQHYELWVINTARFMFLVDLFGEPVH